MNRTFEKREQEPGENRMNVPVDTKLLAKWIKVLFWLIIVSTAAGLFTSNDSEGTKTALEWAAAVVNMAVTIFYSVILLRISSESIRYRIAGICGLAVAAADIFLSVLPGNISFALSVPTVLISLIVSMVEEYYEYMGHREVLEYVNPEMAGKWHKLWKWYLGMVLGVAGGTLVTVFAPLIGLIIVLAVTIGMLIVSILKIIYLYGTSKVFKQ